MGVAPRGVTVLVKVLLSPSMFTASVGMRFATAIGTAAYGVALANGGIAGSNGGGCALEVPGVNLSGVTGGAARSRTSFGLITDKYDDNVD